MPGHSRWVKGTSRKLLRQIEPPGRTGGAIVIAFVLTLCLGHLSSGRQADRDAIRRKVVVVEGLSLRSLDGRIAANLGIDPGNQIAFNIFNQRMSGSLQIGVFQKGASAINLRHTAAKPKMTLGSLPSGQPYLRLSDALPTARLFLGVGTDGVPEFTLENNGVTRLATSQSGRTGGSMSLRSSTQPAKPRCGSIIRRK